MVLIPLDSGYLAAVLDLGEVKLPALPHGASWRRRVKI